MSLRTPLGRVLGLGAAGGGSHHFWAQRVSAVALVPLSVWFVAALVSLPDLGYFTVRAWLGEPAHAVALLLLVPVAAYHAWLGVAVVIEDYVAGPARRLTALLVAQFLHIAAAAGGVYAVLKVALGGAA